MKMKRRLLLWLVTIVLIGSSKLCANTVDMYLPYSMLSSDEDSLLITDTHGNRILKLAEGDLSVVAGQNLLTGGYIDGKSNEAVFNQPIDLAGDLKTGLYISDSENNVLRMIKDSEVMTYAGSGEVGKKDGKAEEASFNLPMGIVLDKDNNLYVADTLNHCIRKVDTKGNVSTLAGSGKAGYQDGSLKEALFNEPTDVILDQEGSLYVLDSGNQCIRKLKEGKVTTLVGGETEVDIETGYKLGGNKDGKNGTFNFPKSFILVDNQYILVADTMNNAIRLVDLEGKVKTIISEADGLIGPSGLVYKDGILFVAEKWTAGIKYFALTFNKEEVVVQEKSMRDVFAAQDVESEEEKTEKHE